MALWGAPSFDKDDDATPKQIIGADEQEAPPELERGAETGASADRRQKLWMKKAKEVIEGAGAACPDFAAEEEGTASWGFDALGALWQSEAWLQNVVLPALHRRREAAPEEVRFAA